MKQLNGFIKELENREEVIKNPDNLTEEEIKMFGGINLSDSEKLELEMVSNLAKRLKIVSTSADTEMQQIKDILKSEDLINDMNARICKLKNIEFTEKNSALLKIREMIQHY